MGDMGLSDSIPSSCRNSSQGGLLSQHLSLLRTIQPQNFSVPGETPAQHVSIILGSIFSGYMSFQPFHSLNSRNLNSSQESVHWLRKGPSLLLPFPQTPWHKTAKAPGHPLAPSSVYGGVPWRGRDSCPRSYISSPHFLLPRQAGI